MKGKGEKMQQVMIGTVCFYLGLVFGGIVGMVVTALCIAVKNMGTVQETEENPCYGCFGASIGDCDNCPIKKGGKGADERKVI